MTQTDFNSILFESVNESIATVLDRPTTSDLVQDLEPYLGISVDEMPHRIDLLFSSIRQTFGTRGDDLCKMIVMKTYQKAGVLFYEVGDRPMIQYMEDLKRKLART